MRWKTQEELVISVNGIKGHHSNTKCLDTKASVTAHSSSYIMKTGLIAMDI
jgi:hypothetical protein